MGEGIVKFESEKMFCSTDSFKLSMADIFFRGCLLKPGTVKRGRAGDASLGWAVLAHQQGREKWALRSSRGLPGVNCIADVMND